ncbi:MAG: cyclic nucleotide-binding and patatin-like phospholipase domain-containing protein [Xanthomonadales bacterium]|nr:cyclic nucleotide-binding and patatin-like phospholipase domain-containing protein [Xanthomonadales bacterium]
MLDTQAQIRQLTESYFGMELPEDSLNEFEIQEIAGGDWLFRQGDDGSSLYLLVRGRLHVLKEDTEQGSPRLLGEVVPGESVGEVGLLSGEKRSAGIRAIRDSLLIKISRKSFERLSASHPALIMKLASHVARLLQRNHAGTAAAAARRLSSITLLPLTTAARSEDFCRELAEGLEGFGRTLTLSAGNLLEKGAPAGVSNDNDGIPGALQFWVHQQETQNRFLIYQCEATDSAWTRFAMRQSDLVVFVADAQDDAAVSDWETRLRAGKGVATGRQALVLLQPPSETPISGTAQWLKHRQADFHLHVRQDSVDDIQRVARVISGKALGLVLGGGGARGFAHLGVYKALLELGIKIDWVGGASIGSIFGAPVASDWTYDKAYRIARHSFVKVKPFSDYNLPVAALIRGRRMERELNAHQDFQIEDMPIPFFCVSSILDSGELSLHESGQVASALRASASLPGVIPPAVVNQRLHIDGAVLNNLPVDIMLCKPVGKIIAVDLSSHKSYEVDYSSIPSPWAILAGRLLPFMRKYRVPTLATTILKATEIGTQQQVRATGKHADLLLRPPVRQFGLTNVSAFEQVVETGYQYAKLELEKWLNVPDEQDSKK